mmetsp:Transcript_10451/g.25453  ORF Transcript_10451/g.25453 Transcript_10451/m.25453 type:complete len:246 (+) Transcript_10451:17-754(+)
MPVMLAPTDDSIEVTNGSRIALLSAKQTSDSSPKTRAACVLPALVEDASKPLTVVCTCTLALKTAKHRVCVPVGTPMIARISGSEALGTISRPCAAKARTALSTTAASASDSAASCLPACATAVTPLTNEATSAGCGPVPLLAKTAVAASDSRACCRVLWSVRKGSSAATTAPLSASPTAPLAPASVSFFAVVHISMRMPRSLGYSDTIIPLTNDDCSEEAWSCLPTVAINRDQNEQKNLGSSPL